MPYCKLFSTIKSNITWTRDYTHRLTMFVLSDTSDCNRFLFPIAHVCRKWFDYQAFNNVEKIVPFLSSFTLIMIDTNNCNNYVIFDLIFLRHEEVSNFPPNCISLNQVLGIVVPRKLLN